MSQYQHVIKQNLEKIINYTIPTPLGAELCNVESVDLTNFTIICTGQATSKVYYDVPLVTVLQDNESIVCIPKIDSKVIVVQIDAFNTFVALTGKLSQMYMTAPEIITTIDDKFQIVDSAGHVEFDILPNGMKLVVDGQSFKEAFDELMTAIENLTVMTSTGASSPPINLADITTAKNKIDSTLQ